MKRYQVYLRPHAVSILDEFEKHADISRSKLIQAAIDRLAGNLAKIFPAHDIPPAKESALDGLIGAIHLKGQKETCYAQKGDRDYLSD